MDFPTPGMYLTPVPQEELERLKNDCEIPDVPTQLTYHLRRAVSGGGDLADEWNNKPHRLIYDACREIERLNVCKQELEDLVEQLNWELVCYESDT
jgi:hypothetical protein